MKEINFKLATLFTLLVMLVFALTEVFAQGPPAPPGVPLDFGVTALILACVGYGVKMIYKKI
ncbi:MAG: hypothetical protein HRT71_16940 [Flavobacteriales bacterium]|nr:hypothetical protein [Flavobacteriales bacterium]